jgi:predicted nucleotidyltransferase
MMAVQTLDDRKKARVEEIRAGFSRLRQELAAYGRDNGGEFWVFGSAATGRFHFDSDIDILVDFDDARLGRALDFVENTCLRLRLKSDVQPKDWCTTAFINRIAPTALVLP